MMDKVQATEDFFNIAKERFKIKLRREAEPNDPTKWTEDPIFRKERFCHVFREHDKTTSWFRENIRGSLFNDHEVLLATLIFRWFNKIETAQRLGAPNDLTLFTGWGEKHRKEVFQRLQGVSPIVTGAYIIKTPNGMTKLEGLLWCIDQFWEKTGPDFGERLHSENWTLQKTTEWLCQFPYLGPFMAYQIVCDLRYTRLLQDAPDIMTWAQPGPGSARGLGRLFKNDVDAFNMSSKKDCEEMIILMRFLLEASKMIWPEKWPKWEMSTVQHWLCETDKYKRAQEGGSMKRKFIAQI